MKITLDSSIEFIIKAATHVAEKYKHTQITSEHIFYIVVQRSEVKDLFLSLDIDLNRIIVELHAFFLQINNKATSQETSNKQNNLTNKKSESFNRLLEYAYCSAARDERNIVEIKDLLVAFLELEQRQISNFQYKTFLNSTQLKNLLKNRYDEPISDIELDFFSDFFDEDSQGYNQDNYDSKSTDEQTITTQLTIDLCEKARKKSFDAFFGQEQVMNQIFEILLRRKKNNIILVGDSGVGKTAIMHEFANRLVHDNVPTELKEHTLFSLDVLSLVAGTRYRGDFESKVKILMNFLSQKTTNLLFLDDIHGIITAGASAANSIDFGDLIKPILADNIIRCIGATTHEEYKSFEKDKTLLRRFNVIEINSPSMQDVLKILKTVKPHYEKFYGIHYSTDILEDIIELSEKYIHERSFPDKAIEILDAIGAMIQVKEYNGKYFTNKIRNKNNPIEVTTKNVEDIVSRISKRPIQSIQKNEMINLVSLQTRLAKNIFGQEIAIEKLTKIIIRSRAGLRDESKPIANLLFVGSTGVGKTELSKQLAKELGMNFQRFDMSEYQEKHTVSKFIGSPPGYVGHESGGLLIDTIRRYPSSLLLLDEIEKAHSDIFNLLLQIMDYSTITDSIGRKADFRNVILIMTSNVGAKESTQQVLGFEPPNAKGVQEIKDAVFQLFSPEFRNRLDDTIIFASLSLKNIKYIVIKELTQIKNLLKKKNINLTWSYDVIKYLVNYGYNPNYGARSVLRIIEEKVKDKLSEVVITIQHDKHYHENFRTKKYSNEIKLELNKPLKDLLIKSNFSEYHIEVKHYNINSQLVV